MLTEYSVPVKDYYKEIETIAKDIADFLDYNRDRAVIITKVMEAAGLPNKPRYRCRLVTRLLQTPHVQVGPIYNVMDGRTWTMAYWVE